MYIAVECQDLEDNCAYKVRVQLLEATATKDLVTRTPARYIPRDQDYVDVTIPYGKTARFYYPVIPELSGDLLIFANKTAPIGKNGDGAMVMNVQKDSAISYLQWIYAKPDYYTIASQTNDPI